MNPTDADAIFAALLAALPPPPPPRVRERPARRPQPDRPGPRCRRCSHGVVSRPRGLCWTCYHTRGVRELYPSTSKLGQRGPGNVYCVDPPLPVPTTAAPGTEAKVRVLMERAARGEALFHPDDARCRDD